MFYFTYALISLHPHFHHPLHHHHHPPHRLPHHQCCYHHHLLLHHTVQLTEQNQQKQQQQQVELMHKAGENKHKKYDYGTVRIMMDILCWNALTKIGFPSSSSSSSS